MHCPVDGSELRITERQGIEIDYCPQWRGIWVDRGSWTRLLSGRHSRRTGKSAIGPRRHQSGMSAIDTATTAPTEARSTAERAGGTRFWRIWVDVD